MSRLISFAVLIASIIFIGLLFYKVLIGFFIPVFLASVLVVVFRPLHRWVLERTGHRDQLAAVLTTLLIMMCLILPLLVVGTAAATQGLRLIDVNDNQYVLEARLNKIRSSLGLEYPPYYRNIVETEESLQLVFEQLSATDHTQEDVKLVQRSDATQNSLITMQQSLIANYGFEAWEDDNNRETSSLRQQFASLTEKLSELGKPLEDGDDHVVRPIEIRTRFSNLKTELLGGQFMALLRRTANPTAEDRQQWTQNVINYVRPRLLSITGATGTFIVKLIFGFVILVVATFFFLFDGPSMVKTVMRLSPLDDAYEQELLLEFDRISRAVVVATLLSAVAQGLTAGIGYFFAGMDVLALLIMLTTVFAMVPFVGPAVIWVPVCLYIGIYEERYTAAILLGVWGVLVVGTIDNFVKAFVLHGQSQLHPLLALLSVLGGVQALGPIGIVVGPMVVAMLQTLLSILQRELTHFDKQNLVLSTQGLSATVSSKGDVDTGAEKQETENKSSNEKAEPSPKPEGKEAPSPNKPDDEVD